MFRITMLLLAFLVSFVANGHHSVSAFYDYENASQLEGTLMNVDWVNPHIRFTLETVDDSGAPEVWAVESGSVNMLERQGVGRGDVTVGDRIRISGHLGRNGTRRLELDRESLEILS